MSQSKIDSLLQRLHDLEQEVEAEVDQALDDKREQFRYSLKQGRIRFDAEVTKLQRRYRTDLVRYIIGANIGHLLTAPLIYSLILPFALLDLMVTVYQWGCFPVYRIPKVRRCDYIAIDRQHLAYLNALEKLNCVYCGYGNGVIAYVREVAARTEQYWCPIKHARRTLDPHRHSEAFVDYGDATVYRERLQALRAALRQLKHPPQ
jgi:hypothetical protein